MNRETYQIILSNEMRLLDRDVRCNSVEITRLVDPDFIEFCSSGKVYRYSDGDTFGCSEGMTFEITGFSVKELSPAIALATYVSVRTDSVTGRKISANRSSLWKKDGPGWRIIFHQGTSRDEASTEMTNTE